MSEPGSKLAQLLCNRDLPPAAVADRVVQAACGGTHTLALTAEGRIFIWGRGSFGRLGLGDERDRYSPVEVKLPGAAGTRVWADASR